MFVVLDTANKDASVFNVLAEAKTNGDVSEQSDFEKMTLVSSGSRYDMPDHKM